jgi:hypothetical protein
MGLAAECCRDSIGYLAPNVIRRLQWILLFCSLSVSQMVLDGTHWLHEVKIRARNIYFISYEHHRAPCIELFAIFCFVTLYSPVSYMNASPPPLDIFLLPDFLFVSCLTFCWTTMIEALCSSEASVDLWIYQTTRRYDSEGHALHGHPCENDKLNKSLVPSPLTSSGLLQQ